MYLMTRSSFTVDSETTCDSVAWVDKMTKMTVNSETVSHTVLSMDNQEKRVKRNIFFEKSCKKQNRKYHRTVVWSSR